MVNTGRLNIDSDSATSPIFRFVVIVRHSTRDSSNTSNLHRVLADMSFLQDGIAAIFPWSVSPESSKDDASSASRSPQPLHTSSNSNSSRGVNTRKRSITNPNDNTFAGGNYREGVKIFDSPPRLSEDIGADIINKRNQSSDDLSSSLSRSRNVSVANFDDSQTKTVLVTGVAGFIGSHVADFLLSRGDFVIAVDELNDYYDVKLKEANLLYLKKKHGNKIKIYKGDICDVSFINPIFEVEKPSFVCHLAARAGVRPSIVDPYVYVHSNIEGTTRLLDLSRIHGIYNFVYASSSSVYGSSTSELLSEKDVVETPVSPYAATKKACELLAYTWHHLYGMNCTGLRFFTVYGPRGRPDMAPFKFIDRIFNELPIQQYGDGSTSRDYTYIDDIVDGVVRAIDRPLGYQVINLGNGRPFLLRNFIKLVEECVGKAAIIEILPEQPGDVERTCADITKAKSLLGYSPKVTFEDGISRTADWYKQAHADGLFASEHSIISVDRKDSFKRVESDLELSSYVEKATKRVRNRMRRIL